MISSEMLNSLSVPLRLSKLVTDLLCCCVVIKLSHFESFSLDYFLVSLLFLALQHLFAFSMLIWFLSTCRWTAAHSFFLALIYLFFLFPSSSYLACPRRPPNKGGERKHTSSACLRSPTLTAGESLAPCRHLNQLCSPGRVKAHGVHVLFVSNLQKKKKLQGYNLFILPSHLSVDDSAE